MVLNSGSGRRYYPATDTADGLLKAADFARLALLADPPRARIYRTVAQAIASGGGGAAISFDATRENSAGASGGTVPWVIGSSTRLTVPTGGGGYYALGGGLAYAGTAGGNFRQMYIRLNGATLLVVDQYLNPTGGVGPQLSVATEYRLADGDYLEMIASHDQGAGLNTTAGPNYSVEFWFHRICA